MTAAPMLTLHVLQGPDAGKRYPLPANEPQLIGRSTEAIDITDKTVSRRHAELTPDDGAWFVRDLESSNGTFVNGRPVFDRTPIQAGDRIRCGDTLFVVASEAELPEAASPTARAPAVVAIEARLPANAPAVADPRFRMLQELASLADDAADRATLIDKALRIAREEFGAERAAFAILGPSAALIERADCAEGKGAPAIPREAVEESMRTGAGLLTLAAGIDGPDTSSALCVAVRTPDRTLGVLWLERTVKAGAFDERHLRLLQAVGAHLGLLLRHGELVEATLARERLAAMGETVANLSHSIKNILQALRGGADAVELALSRGDLGMAREGWPILGRNLDRIHSLTRNMLAYAKERALDLLQQNVNEIVSEVTLLLEPAAERKRVKLVVELDPAMPPIVVDPDAIHQAVMNLVSNALDAVADRVGRVTVRTRYVPKGSESDSSHVEIAIVDNGPGIPDAIRSKLFEPFTSSKGQRGTGLGLVVTRKIAEQHGGAIEVITTGPDGTLMCLTLPDRGQPLDSEGTHFPKAIGEADLGVEFGPPE
ncbi:MAG: FHA domain-containing protein [Phycisphaerae bacterium]|nr:FHA domain-containing protein [Phycisphaerae bacterium]